MAGVFLRLYRISSCLDDNVVAGDGSRRLKRNFLGNFEEERGGQTSLVEASVYHEDRQYSDTIATDLASCRRESIEVL